MATTTRLKRKLISAVIESPSRIRSACYVRAYLHPVRAQCLSTISNSRPQERPRTFSVTFGDPETDALIARLAGKKKSAKKVDTTSQTDTQDTTADSDAISPAANVERGDVTLEGISESSGKSRTISKYKPEKQSKTKPRNRGEHVPLPGDVQSLFNRSKTLSQSSLSSKATHINKLHRHNHPPSSNQDSSTAIPSSQIRIPPKPLEPWQIQKQALRQKLNNEPWNPRKKLSPDAIQGIKDLHTQDPVKNSLSVLAEQFEVSPEAIRRILKSNWHPTEDKMQERRERWAKRHDMIWDRQAELGLKPPRQKPKKVDGIEVFEEGVRAKQILGRAREGY